MPTDKRWKVSKKINKKIISFKRQQKTWERLRPSASALGVRGMVSSRAPRPQKEAGPSTSRVRHFDPALGRPPSQNEHFPRSLTAE